MLLEETQKSLSKMMSIFKKHNSNWESIRALMSDKDLTERDALAVSFPNSQLLICLYHTFHSFRCEVVVEKMGITSGQRNTSLEMLQQLAYTTSEENYQELYSQFCKCCPNTVVQYFNDNWHPIRNQWTMGMKFSSGNFLYSTNNRLECINGKLKSVISRYSSLENFVDNFFLILRVLRSERDHKAALIAQKIPVFSHTTTDKASVSYMQHFTPYAYKFVRNQIELFEKVKLIQEDEGFHVESSEGHIFVTISACECSWKSMKPPCRHIFAVCSKLGIELFDEILCDKRWSTWYYKENQRIFCDDASIDHPDVEIAQLPTPGKRILSQVL